MFNLDENKNWPYAIFLVSMSFTAVVLTIVIVLGALGVIGV